MSGASSTFCISVVLLVTVFVAIVIVGFAHIYVRDVYARSDKPDDMFKMQEIFNHLRHMENRQRSQFASLHQSIANLTEQQQQQQQQQQQNEREKQQQLATSPAPPDAHVAGRPRWRSNLSHTESYQRQCYLPTNTNRFSMSPANYVINDNAGFVYFEIPKVASTALRLLMTRNFQDSSRLLRGAWHLSAKQFAYFKFSCVRDPLDRFVSTFNFLSVFMKSLRKDREGGLGSRKVVTAAEAWALQIFLEGWWDWHLWPQSSYLANNDGSPRAIDFICDQSNLQEVFDEVTEHTHAKRVAAKKIPPFGGRFTKEKVLLMEHLSATTVLLICQSYRADYCCFSFPLPTECQRALERSNVTSANAAKQAMCEDFSSSLAAREAVKRQDSEGVFVSGLDLAALERKHRGHLTDMKLHEPHLYGDESNAIRQYKNGVQKRRI